MIQDIPYVSQGAQNFSRSATVATLADRLKLENLTPELNLEERPIKVYSILRPSFQLTGFFETFDPLRVQVVGLTEQDYMKKLDREILLERLEKIASYNIPCLVFTRGLPVDEQLIRIFSSHGIPVLRSNRETAEIESELIKNMRMLLAPIETVHGVLVDVYGIGVLIRGDSGIGKSEAALELIRRGHRLVSDDIVELHKVSDETLVGVAPELTRDFIELRGIGIINIRAMFGFEAVKSSQNIDMEVNLEEYSGKKKYDRFGLEPQYDELMGIKISKYDIPIKPGRNIAVIVEAAAINYRAKIMGHNAPQEFIARINQVKSRSMEDDII